MGKLLTRRHACAAAALLTASALLTACDQSDVRADRARDLADAALEQLSGGGDRGADGVSMADVPLEARALAGEVLAPDSLLVANVQPSRFAVGSIIAKPKADPDPEPLAMDTPEEIGELPVLEIDPEDPIDPEEIEAKTAPVIQKAEEVRGRSAPLSQRMRKADLGGGARPALDDADVVMETESVDGAIDAARNAARAVAIPGAGQADDAEDETEAAESAVEAEEALAQARESKRAMRRSVVNPRAIEAQTNAHSKMQDVMSQYGLSGSVELTPTGQMKIQLGADGADPTQTTTEEVRDGIVAAAADLPAMAYESEQECPDDVNPERVRQDPVLATICVVESLRKTGEFAYVEKDYIFENQFAQRPDDSVITPVPATGRPNDPLFDLQWHFQNNGDGEADSAGGAGFAEFWRRNPERGSRDVVVAVVDTGLQLDHPDIAGSPNVAGGWDMVSDPRMGNDGDGRDGDPDDPGDLCDPTVRGAADSYHGTHVAGTIGAAASDNGAGVAGGAWNVTLVPVRALGKCGGRLSDINDSIRWAGGLIPAFDPVRGEVWNDNPADIINLSIGLFQFCPASLQDAINEVTERGAIVVAAAGNARVSTRFYAPGGCNNVISVAASDARGQITPYSNFGAEVDVLAPGGDLTRDDDGDGRPDGVLSTKQASNCVDPLTGDPVASCFYAYEQGTSMAAPHVSAALALLKAKFPDKSAEELQSVLLGALDPRETLQCAGPCTQFPGAEPIEESGGQCARPCGGGLLNLANIDSD